MKSKDIMIRTRPIVLQPRVVVPPAPVLSAVSIRDLILGFALAAAITMGVQARDLQAEQKEIRMLAAQIQQLQANKPVEAKYVRPEPFEMEPRLIPLGDKRRDVCIQTAWRW